MDCAKETFQASRDFDWVIAVFDRDDHLTYNDALITAAALNQTVKNDARRLVGFRAVASVPCFELWILLHFQNVHAFWHRDEIIAAVSGGGCLPGYHKGATGVYARTESRIAQATARAESLRAQFDAATGTDPYTDMDWLIGKLRALADA